MADTTAPSFSTRSSKPSGGLPAHYFGGASPLGYYAEGGKLGGGIARLSCSSRYACNRRWLPLVNPPLIPALHNTIVLQSLYLIVLEPPSKCVGNVNKSCMKIRIALET